jgi:hypothetical protein
MRALQDRIGIHFLLKTKFAVRAKTDKLQGAGVRLAVDENEIGPYVAIAVILPVPGQGMVAKPLRQLLVGRKRNQNRPYQPIELCSVRAT